MSTIMNFILEGSLKQTVLYTCSTIMNFILEGKLCFTETKRLCRITLYVYWLLNCFVAILYTIVRNYNRLQDTGTDKDKKGGTREEILVPSVSFLPQVPVPLAQAVSNYRGAKTLIN